MRPAPILAIEPWRIAGEQCTRSGAFQVPHNATGVSLRVIASDGDGWEHVSVSLPNRTPNWREMEFICRLWWHEEEAVMQLHPPRSGWISNHPYCLHLWRPTAAAIPLPPPLMVGVPGLQFDPRDANDRRVAGALWRIGGGQ